MGCRHSPDANIAEIMTNDTQKKIDLIVVGAGIAGLVCAIRALELGQVVTLLEAQHEQKYACATRMSGGAFHVIFNNVTLPPEELFQALKLGTKGHADLSLCRAIADHASRSVCWLRDLGVKFDRLEPDRGWTDTVLAPLGYQDNTELVWEGLGSDVMMQTLESQFVAKGGRFLRGHRARRLLSEAAHCTGVVVEVDGAEISFHSRAVVLADGSFHGNRRLVQEHITSDPEQLLKRGPTTGLGDGIEMAQAMGAHLLGMEYFYGHLLSLDALHNQSLVLFPFIDFLASAGMLVSPRGLRFADEGLGGRYLTNRLAHTETGVAFAIFDHTIWECEGRSFHSAPNPNLVENGGTLYVADSLEELADVANIDRNALCDSVAQYNAALDAGSLPRLDPPRTSAGTKAQPIQNSPFYAVPTCAAISHAFGGVMIDDRARVLRKDGSPIEGLYAAGASCGGIDGGPEAAYVGGLIIGAVFGLLAAETFAQQH